MQIYDNYLKSKKRRGKKMESGVQKYSLLLAHSPAPSCLYPMFWAQNVTFVTKETCKREKRYIIIWKIKDNFVAEKTFASQARQMGQKEASYQQPCLLERKERFNIALSTQNDDEERNT